jgi:adenylosuccinate lyase
MDNFDIYENPLTARYASKEMSGLFSQRHRIIKFRQLWTALAKAEKQLGLNISDAQIQELERNAENIDFATVSEYEKKLRHDVMAHIHAYGDCCPTAKPIIHLGATSCFVTDNADIIIYDEALRLIKKYIINTLSRLQAFASAHKALPTLGYTHLQPAQLTTVGKRATLWMQDLVMDLEQIERLLAASRLRGVKGTTGTQASFLELFNGDHERVMRLDKLVTNQMGYKNSYAVTGQTYPRKLDYQILSALSMTAQSAYKFSGDIRLLQSFKEIEEPAEKQQVGSSAMAYKRNPMRCERMGAIARYLISLPVNAAMTSSAQWMERTLDDSANRRIVMAQAFLATDAVFNIYLNAAEGLTVYPSVIKKRINLELPFMATENVIMECVKAGGDRQLLHERIRVLSAEAAENVKVRGGENNLIELIKKDKEFFAVRDKLDGILKAENFIGRATEQTEEFIEGTVSPILEKNKKLLGAHGEVKY